MEQLKEWTEKQVGTLKAYSKNTKPITKTDSEIADRLIKMNEESFAESFIRKLFGDTTATRAFLAEFFRKKRALSSSAASSSSASAQPKQPVAPKGMEVLHSKKTFVEVKKKQQQQQGPKKSKADSAAQKDKGSADVRLVCDCFGTVHKALTNCLNCGKIVCEKEGYGPCSFCGYPVGKDAAGRAANDKDAAKAIELKNRLLKYDRTAAKRTTIYDDQEDYFTSSPWLSSDEIKSREEKAKQRELDKQ